MKAFECTFTLRSGVVVTVSASCSASETRDIMRAIPSFAVECGADIVNGASWHPGLTDRHRGVSFGVNPATVLAAGLRSAGLPLDEEKVHELEEYCDHPVRP